MRVIVVEVPDLAGSIVSKDFIGKYCDGIRPYLLGRPVDSNRRHFPSSLGAYMAEFRSRFQFLGL